MLQLRQQNTHPLSSGSHDISVYLNAGPDLRGGANWAVAQGPPKLRGLHKKTVKILPKET